MRRLLASSAVLASFAFASVASAQLVQVSDFTGATGGGLGGQSTILTITSPQNSIDAEGCVRWDGAARSFANCGFLDANVQQGAAQTQSLMLSSFPNMFTGSNILVAFNGSQPGNGDATPITIEDLVLSLYSANGTLTFSSSAFTPVELLPGSGVGNFGFVFGLTGGDVALFNAAVAGSSYIGLGAELTNSTGGLETFSIIQAGNIGTNVVVPEPSTYALMATGLLALGFASRRRRSA